MKKSRQRSKPARERRKAAAVSEKHPEVADDGRRSALIRIRNYSLAAAVLGGGGWYVGSGFFDALAEEDLTLIGNGIPTIVQIHDPQCPTCRALQKEVRAALKEFGQGELQYLVANVRSSKGRSFAAMHGVGHVTVLIFDGLGRRQQILRGPSTRERLKRVFRSYAKRQPTKAKTPEPTTGPKDGQGRAETPTS